MKKANRRGVRKPKKRPYEKPKIEGISLKDDEALLRLFKRNRKSVQELKNVVKAVIEKSKGY